MMFQNSINVSQGNDLLEQTSSRFETRRAASAVEMQNTIWICLNACQTEPVKLSLSKFACQTELVEVRLSAWACRRPRGRSPRNQINIIDRFLINWFWNNILGCSNFDRGGAWAAIDISLKCWLSMELIWLTGLRQAQADTHLRYFKVAKMSFSIGRSESLFAPADSYSVWHTF